MLVSWEIQVYLIVLKTILTDVTLPLFVLIEVAKFLNLRRLKCILRTFLLLLRSIHEKILDAFLSKKYFGFTEVGCKKN
ncbi:MAG: hypothetical protein EBR54_00250 [Flavobacteriia bacterium]|nr:hypothetical protein [Flavobacteriia bacterium]